MVATFIYTVDSFFYFNKLWQIREVVRPCYNAKHNDEYEVAGGLTLRGVPMDYDSILAYVCPMTTEDDWVDVYHADGRIVRNVQESALWQEKQEKLMTAS